MKVWSRAVGVTMCLVLSGCADGAKLVQEDAQGGIVVYPFRGDQGSLLSTFRKEALAIMNSKCGGRPYSIVREGETRTRVRVAGPMEGGEEIVPERRWGVQFQCK